MLKGSIKRCLAPWLVVWRGPSDSNRVSLTFDDGPDEAHTPAVLDALKASRAKATFFLVGEKAKRHVDIARRISSEGHEICSHSYRHDRLINMPLSGIRGDLKAAEEAFAAIGVAHAAGFLRPPYGCIGIKLLLISALRGVKIVLWSKDPEDFACKGSAEILSYFRANPIVSGDIVLLHDKSGATAGALERLIADIRLKGIEPVTLKELLSPRR
ncbi:MAG: polysaccharide deacetylase family protein [Deltaproteobacteria bacterium]